MADIFFCIYAGDRFVLCCDASFLFQLSDKEFLSSDFVTSARYMNEATERVIEVPLKLTQLKPGDIPSIFPNSPSYLSCPETTVREASEEKRVRLDAEALHEEIQLHRSS